MLSLCRLFTEASMCVRDQSWYCPDGTRARGHPELLQNVLVLVPSRKSCGHCISDAHRRLPPNHHQSDRGEEMLPEAWNRAAIPSKCVPQLAQ